MAFNGGIKRKSPSDLRSLAIQLIAGRWFMFFASILIMTAAGVTYLFGMYSDEIKSTLGYDQTTLNLLSFFKDLGAHVGLHSGFLNEMTKPWFVLLVGAILNFMGYFMIWMSITKRIPTPQVWHMCLFMFVSANSQSFVKTGTLVTCVKNFTKSRGIVLGILMGYFGLSSAIIAQVYNALDYNDTKGLVLLIAWLPAAISFAFLGTMRIMKATSDQNELKVLYSFLYISLGLAGFLMIFIILEKRFPFSRSEYRVSAAGVIFLLFLPLTIIIIEEFKIWKAERELHVARDPSQLNVISRKPPTPPSAHQEALAKLPLAAAPISAASAIDKKQPSCWETAFQPPDQGEDYTILQALFSIDMLILFLTMMCGAGGTLTAIDNLGQIGTSLGYQKSSIGTFISMVSIWNYLGRVVSGFTSEILLTKYGFPRPLMLTINLLLSCVGHLLVAFGSPSGLYIASIIIGFCCGVQWPLFHAIVSEIFGLKYYATLYNLGSLSSPIGIYLFNVKVTGNLYDKEARRQMAEMGLTRKAGDDLNCNGVKCFQQAFLIITAANFVGALVSSILVARTRGFYRGDIYKKHREALTRRNGIEIGAAQANPEVITPGVSIFCRDLSQKKPQDKTETGRIHTHKATCKKSQQDEQKDLHCNKVRSSTRTELPRSRRNEIEYIKTRT